MRGSCSAYSTIHKLLLLVCFTVAVACPSLAASPMPIVDSSKPLKPHKLTEQQFLNEYGKTDTARALIRFYFQETKSSRLGFIISPLVIGAGAFALDRIAKSDRFGGWNFLVGLFLVIVVASLLVYLSIIFILTSTRLIRFSRKKLLQQLKSLQAGAPLPKHIAHNNAFTLFLKKEQGRN